MLQVVPLRHDDIIVPVLVLDLRLNLFRVTNGAASLHYVFLWVGVIGFDDRLLSALGEDAAALLFVENSAVDFTGLKIGLVSTHDRPLGSLPQDFAPILDARIPV